MTAAGSRATLPPLPDILASRILVVEDNPLSRDLLVALLSRQGFRDISVAADGAQALEGIERLQPDLVLLDVMMPVMDGFTLCRRLRALPRFRDLPILMQTSLDRPQDRVMAFSAGATDLVTKPLNPQELLARVRIHLQSRVLIRELTYYQQRTSADLARARATQRKLLPGEAELHTLAVTSGLMVECLYEPSSELGGDHWGLSADSSGRPVVYLVDFSGHGVMAALNVARLQVLLRHHRFNADSPGAQLAEFNRALCPLLGPGQFATMLLAYIDLANDQLVYASAGAMPPLHWQAAEGTAAGESDGLPLGLSVDAEYEDRSVPLKEGGDILLYSDAAVDIEQTVSFLGEAGLRREIEGWRQRPPATLSALRETLQNCGTLRDDLTVVWIKRRTGQA
jgi:phosphoserine phosphatase RsbU/P